MWPSMCIVSGASYSYSPSVSSLPDIAYRKRVLRLFELPPAINCVSKQVNTMCGLMLCSESYFSTSGSSPEKLFCLLKFPLAMRTLAKFKIAVECLNMICIRSFLTTRSSLSQQPLSVFLLPILVSVGPSALMLVNLFVYSTPNIFMLSEIAS